MNSLPIFISFSGQACELNRSEEHPSTLNNCFMEAFLRWEQNVLQRAACYLITETLGPNKASCIHTEIVQMKSSPS